MLSENRTELKVQILLKQFVRTEPGSPFADEISLILDSYLSKTLKNIRHSQGGLEPYDIRFFNSLIPYSVLAKELVEKFVEAPQQAFDENGDAIPEWDNVPPAVRKKREESCAFNSNSKSSDQIRNDKSATSIEKQRSIVHDEAIIRRQHELFKIDVNQENLGQVMELLLKDHSVGKNPEGAEEQAS